MCLYLYLIFVEYPALWCTFTQFAYTQSGGKLKAKPSQERIYMESIHEKYFFCVADIMKSVVCLHLLSCKFVTRYCIYYEIQIKKIYCPYWGRAR